MTKAYRAHDPLGTYFMTMTVVDWVDAFTNLEFKDLVVNSLKYCMEHKGLDLYAWVLMSNHIHLIGAAREPYLLSDIVRDFKKYTNRRIIAGLESGCDSRGVWMLKKFEYARGKRHGIEGYKLGKMVTMPLIFLMPRYSSKSSNTRTTIL